VQEVSDRKAALDVARRGNDYLAEQVAKRPDRFMALAALPMQDPDAAARELERCVKQCGFKGALVNGYSQIDNADSAYYYDLPQFWPFWAAVESLNVPLYLHPRDVLPSRRQAYEGHPWLCGSPWTFGVETATHALRLMGSGLFEKYPKLTIILGHLGENLPNCMWRLDHRMNRIPLGYAGKQKLGYYLRNNFYVTTSGNFYTPALMNAIAYMGVERVLFSVDYPYESMAHAAGWFDAIDTISEADRIKIARGNAERLFGLGSAKRAAFA
jgi:predicted TIM-barrel fold metal-dependent hydrolase